MLSVRCSSWVSRPVASSRTSPNSGRDGPRAELDAGVDAVGEHARHVLRQAAAGDVGERLDVARGERRREDVEVVAVRLEQGVAEWAVEPGRDGVHRDPREHRAQQGVPVRVRAARCHADQRVADRDVGAGEQLRPVRRRRRACRRCRTHPARRRRASRPSRRRAACTPPPRRPRPCRRRSRRRGRRRACWRRCSRGRTTAGPPARGRRRRSG